MVDAFAVVREASRRVLGLRHYPVQLLGGVVLFQGKIAQMNTGEGKTLVATLPAYLNAMTESVLTQAMVSVMDLKDFMDLKAIFPFIAFENIQAYHQSEAVTKAVLKLCEVQLKQKTQCLGEDGLAIFERRTILKYMDEAWVDHMDQLTQLRQGVGLRSYGQLDPVQEFSIESSDLFNHLMDEVAFKVVKHLHSACLVPKFRVS